MTTPRQYPLPLPVLNAMGAEDFLISSANEEAVHWLLDRMPDQWPGHALVLWGAEGAGKTHLLSIWVHKRKAKRVRPGDETLAQLVENPDLAEAFAIDDVEVIAGKPEKEEWLQHFYNATKAAHKPLLLTARSAPSAWGVTLKDIETRLKSSPAVQLHEPDDALMRGLLLKLFSDRQLLVDMGVVEYLALRLERTGTALRHAVALLDEAALASKRKISIPFVQKTLNF